MDAIIDENKKSWLQRFILWREKKIKEKHFILILSFLAGIFTALAAWFLKFLVEWIKEFLTENFDSTGVNWFFVFGFPATFFPVMDPLGDTLADILAVGTQNDFAMFF